MIPDQGIYPMAPRLRDHRRVHGLAQDEHAPALGIDADNAPIIGITLQKSHINTKDDAHYVSLVMELESKGALVVPTCARHRRARAAARRRSPPHPSPSSRRASRSPARSNPAGTRARSTSPSRSTSTSSTPPARRSST